MIFFHKAFVKSNMFEVAKIEGRVRYSVFKKTIKVMITPTHTLDDLKAQLNTYFEYLGENQYTRHLFSQMPCMDLGEDKDEDMWKTAIYEPCLIRDDSDVSFMFRHMVEDNILYVCSFHLHMRRMSIDILCNDI
jgi:hypothetical protein